MRAFALLFLALLSCTKIPGPDASPSQKDDRQELSQEESDMPEKIQITVSGKTLPVRIENNEATKALVAALHESSITYEAHDYGGFEKVGALGPRFHQATHR